MTRPSPLPPDDRWHEPRLPDRAGAWTNDDEASTWLLDDLEELSDTLTRTSERLRIHVQHYGYQNTADHTGLTLRTVQRWSTEIPLAKTLKHAADRRSIAAKEIAEIDAIIDQQRRLRRPADS